MTQYTNHTDVEKREMLRIDGIIEPPEREGDPFYGDFLY